MKSLGLQNFLGGQGYTFGRNPSNFAQKCPNLDIQGSKVDLRNCDFEKKSCKGICFALYLKWTLTNIFFETAPWNFFGSCPIYP